MFLLGFLPLFPARLISHEAIIRAAIIRVLSSKTCEASRDEGIWCLTKNETRNWSALKIVTKTIPWFQRVPDDAVRVQTRFASSLIIDPLLEMHAGGWIEES